VSIGNFATAEGKRETARKGGSETEGWKINIHNSLGSQILRGRYGIKTNKSWFNRTGYLENQEGKNDILKRQGPGAGPKLYGGSHSSSGKMSKKWHET